MKSSARTLFSLIIQQDAMTKLMKLPNAETISNSKEPHGVKENMYSLMLLGKAKLNWSITALIVFLNASLALWR